MISLASLAIHLNRHSNYRVFHVNDGNPFLFETVPSLDGIESPIDLVTKVTSWARASKPEVPLDSFYLQLSDGTLASFKDTSFEELEQRLGSIDGDSKVNEKKVPNPLRGIVSCEEKGISYFACCHKENGLLHTSSMVFRMEDFVPNVVITIEVPTGGSPLTTMLEEETADAIAGVLMTLCKPTVFFADHFNPGRSASKELKGGTIIYRDFVCEKWGTIKICLSYNSDPSTDKLLSFETDSDDLAIFPFVHLVLINLTRNLSSSIKECLQDDSSHLQSFQSFLLDKPTTNVTCYHRTIPLYL